MDHHKLGDLTTAQPPYLRFEPVGCTGTILLNLHREAGLTVEALDARLMLSAILSDTLHFRSPTTTQEDRDAVAFLAPVAGSRTLRRTRWRCSPRRVTWGHPGGHAAAHGLQGVPVR